MPRASVNVLWEGGREGGKEGGREEGREGGRERVCVRELPVHELLVASTLKEAALM
jgi:predicted transposase YdaD